MKHQPLSVSFLAIIYLQTLLFNTHLLVATLINQNVWSIQTITLFSGLITKYTYNSNSDLKRKRQTLKVLKPSQQLKPHFLKSMFFLQSFSCAFFLQASAGTWETSRKPFQEGKGAGEFCSSRVLVLYFSLSQLYPLSIWKDTTPVA